MKNLGSRPRPSRTSLRRHLNASAMIIGVDFDNTIVCYDGIFHRVAVERGLVPPEIPVNKTAVRDHLRRIGQEPAWTELQGYVYGPRMTEADIFPGVKEFFRTCRERGIPVKIISHKTRFPYAGEKHDLHAAALGWLERQGFFSANEVGLPREAVFFELTKQEKLARIPSAGCTVFIDDLPEFLGEPAFPPGTCRFLFDPLDALPDDPSRERVRSWAEVARKIFDAEPSDGDAAPAATDRLFATLGMRLAAPPIRLAGGGNNRVFEARNDAGGRFLLKQYFFHAGDQRNRFEAEQMFYRLTAIAAPGHAPRALGWNAVARLGLLEFVEGRKLTATEVGPREVNAALAFFTALNRARSLAEARALPMAAEACFSGVEHCEVVDRRIERLRTISGDAEIDREARDFAVGELMSAWVDIRADVVAQSGAGVGAALEPAERCVSPSDFGFHNTLRRRDGTLVFLDFEYAGWDDPAKTVCDFFCQPALPAPRSEFERFARGVAAAVGLANGESFVARCRLLLPVYRLKWCGIMLNDFVRSDHGRRVFALGAGVAAERKAAQLIAAHRGLALARESLHGAKA